MTRNVKGVDGKGEKYWNEDGGTEKALAFSSPSQALNNLKV